MILPMAFRFLEIRRKCQESETTSDWFPVVYNAWLLYHMIDLTELKQQHGY